MLSACYPYTSFLKKKKEKVNSIYPLTALRFYLSIYLSFYLLSALITSPYGIDCEDQTNTARFSPHDHVHHLIPQDLTLLRLP